LEPAPHKETFRSSYAVTAFGWMPIERSSRLSTCETETYRQNGRSNLGW